jgi:hypothetical protein
MVTLGIVFLLIQEITRFLKSLSFKTGSGEAIRPYHHLSNGSAAFITTVY